MALLPQLLHRLRYSRLSLGYAKAQLILAVERAGVILVQRRGQSLSARDATEVYDSAMYHGMLLDRTRVDAYRAALRRLAPGRRVLDIGTGASAILARMALDAGAQSATGLESNPQSFRAATALARELGIEGKLRIRQAFSTDFTLEGEPPFDLLVHEILGSVGSEEGAPAVVADAKRRLLTPDAVHIPSVCKTRISPVMPLEPLRPIDVLASQIIGEGQTTPDEVGVYFVANFPPGKRLAAAQDFESFEFARDLELVQQRELRFQLGRPAGASHADAHVLFDGFVLWLELTVDSDQVVDSLHQRTSWAPIYVKLLAQPVVLPVGAELVVHTEVNTESLTSSYGIRVTLPSGQTAETRWSGFW